MKKTLKYIRVEKSDAQALIQALKRRLNNQRIINQRYKILYEDNYVLFPINPKKIINKSFKLTSNKLKNFQIVSRKAIPNHNYKISSLKSALSKQLPKKLINLVPKSYDIIGDIAILEFNQTDSYSKEKYIKFKENVAEKLASMNKSISRVYEKESEIKGVYRLRDFKLLYGTDNPETTHKENHCYFKLDIKRAYFSPRLVFERSRLASLMFNEGECIIDLFAGVGPYSIQIAKKYNVIIHAFDANPDAYYYLKENIRINKIKGKINPYLMDIIELLNSKNNTGIRLANSSNRVIMNLPEKSLEYLKVACFLLNSSGSIIHIYQFNDKPMATKKSIYQVQLALNKLGWQIVDIMKAKVVKPYSPKTDLTVLDLNVKKIEP